MNETLKEGSKGSTGGGPGRVKNLLVVAEVALSLALLIGAGLLINSFMRLSRVDPGFRSENLLMLEVFPPYSKYPDTTRRAAFYDEILQRIEALPGVESASVVTNVPTTGSLSDMLYFAETQAELKPFKAVLRVCGADYFRTMGMPIVSGRAFQEQDRLGQAGVVIINERVAQLYWPGEDAVGKRLKMGQVSTPWLTVVGVVKDTRLQFQEAPPPQVYSPYRQLPSFGPRHLVVRAQSAPLQLVDAVRGAIWAVDSDQAIGSIQTMASLVAEHVAPQRFNMLLLTNFALLALVLAAVGLYGVLSYTVTQNTREIGIRQALGARPVDVLKLVIGQGLLLAMVGVGIGLIGAYWLTRLMVKLLYEVSATDPLTFVGAFVVMIIVTLLACYLPARRATKVDPIVALRYE